MIQFVIGLGMWLYPVSLPFPVWPQLLSDPRLPPSCVSSIPLLFRLNEDMSNSGDGGEDAARQFASITGADPSTAAFFLDSCNGDLQSAVDRFFAEDGDLPTAEAAEFVPPRPNVRPDPAVPSPAPKPDTKATPAVQPHSGNVRGLSDYIRKGNSENGMADEDDADDDDSDGGHNEYYTGGEKSGTTVRGGREKDRERGLVDGLFDSARRHGAVAGTEEDLRPGGSERVRVFTGRARTLTGRDSHTAPDPTSETVAHTITFYLNGVSETSQEG